MRRLTIVLSVALASCGVAKADIASTTCDEVEAEAIRISEGSLIKIIKSRETSRTDNELVCHGNGVFKHGDDVETRYRAYRDEDGEIMVAWDTDEAAKRAQDAAVAEAKQASDAAMAEAEREAEAFVEDAQREIREAGSGTY